MIRVSPERKAVSDYLARIKYDDFPEFIRDVLKSQGHADVQITDGAGDEKQDVLSTTPSGERQLTQCKHTVNSDQHYSGDELDLLFAACNRKNCTRGLLATNGDLTAQAKRYITDREYTRLAERSGAALVELDYWNGTRIWDLIATDDAILNKWFSGMGQTHGLRGFSFELVVHRMPDGENNAIKYADLIGSLGVPVQKTDAGVPIVRVNPTIRFSIEDWFARDLDLGVNFIAPVPKHGLVNVPLPAFKIHITIDGAVGAYDPAKCRDDVVRFIGERLPKPGDNQWWHIIATPCRAFLFLQDIVQPKVVTITDAGTFVGVANSPVTAETEWLSLSGNGYARVTDDGVDDLHWKHIPSGTAIKVYMAQRPHPVAAYEHYIRQIALAKRIAQYEFRALAQFSQGDLDRVRHFVTDPNWVIMSSDRGELFWAFPPETDPQRVVEIDSKLAEQGLQVLRVRDEDRAKVVGAIDITPPAGEWFMNDSEASLSVPAWLDQRMFWLTSEVAANRPKKIGTWMELLKFKAHYEVQHGYDFMHGETQRHLSAEEIQPLLFDLFTMRGSRMLDFALVKGQLHINLRISERSISATNALMPAYTAELDRLTSEIVTIIKRDAVQPEPTLAAT